MLTTVGGEAADEPATIARYEDEGSPYHSTARLWDDGVIDPLDTRKVLALGLDAASRAPIEPTDLRGVPDVSDVRVTREGPVTTLTLDRPDRRNALSPELIVALADAVDDAGRRRRRAGRGARRRGHRVLGRRRHRVDARETRRSTRRRTSRRPEALRDGVRDPRHVPEGRGRPRARAGDRRRRRARRVRRRGRRERREPGSRSPRCGSGCCRRRSPRTWSARSARRAARALFTTRPARSTPHEALTARSRAPSRARRRAR